MPGNQHNSRKVDLWAYICTAHDHLIQGEWEAAQAWLAKYRREYAEAPASTRRRWRCGR